MTTLEAYRDQQAYERSLGPALTAEDEAAAIAHQAKSIDFADLIEDMTEAADMIQTALRTGNADMVGRGVANIIKARAQRCGMYDVHLVAEGPDAETAFAMAVLGGRL